MGSSNYVALAGYNNNEGVSFGSWAPSGGANLTAASPPNTEAQWMNTLNQEIADAHQASLQYKWEYSIFQNAIKQDFSGWKGALYYFWTGGDIDGYHYDFDGNVTGLAPLTGTIPVSINSLGSINNMSQGLKSLFRDGVKGNSIINIRSTLLNNGFTQTITNNKSGYLLINKMGEQVRIMSRYGKWDVRVMNQYGNYLDEFGRIASPINSHGLYVYPW